ncbi:hypothetical protein N0V93_003860 [Gnomoniopsis smithogilvyi]|uniref:Uncharacterized protein n=1 Tax=Gnomoniopsis smithogilvyi TaxID=1191159 RepID=A0A9W8YZ99_9PEZI|nr:hypothetical protein N0V93_003860 [Gnomoniopsis smithogilvyi]
MHCNSFLVVLFSLTGLSVALPPPKVVAPFKTSTSAEVTTVSHATPHEVTATQGANANQDVTTLGDLVVTETIIEHGVYPPEEKWTTIHLSSFSMPTPGKPSMSNTVTKGKAGKAGKATKATKITETKVAPTHVAPSTCTTYYPSTMRQLSEAFPDVMQENVANTTKAFHVAQSISFADRIKFNRIHQYVAFDNITAGSWDCQLMVSWPDSQHGDMKVTSSSNRGSSASSGVSLDVYSASYNASAYASLTSPQLAHKNTPNNNGPFSTWAGMMSALKINGNNQLSVSDREKGQDKSAVSTDARLTYFGTVGVNPGEYGLTINSEACPSSTGNTLEYLFEIPTTDSRDESVSFQASKEKGAGVYLLANC